MTSEKLLSVAHDCTVNQLGGYIAEFCSYVSAEKCIKLNLQP